MNPFKFKESNTVLAERQPQYKPLPVFFDRNSDDKPMVSCWKLNFRERMKILFCGKVWLLVATYGKPYQPTLLTTKKKDVLIVKK
jgi:hypothetical protein